MKRYARIALNIGVFSEFTYSIPGNLEDSITTGSYVSVPFGRGNAVQWGFCVGFTDKPVKGMKAVRSINGSNPLVSESFIRICTWISRYYMSPLGVVLGNLVPAGIKNRTVGRLPEKVILLKTDTASLSRARKQKAVIEFLTESDAPVLKEKLISKTRCSASVLKALQEKEFIRMEPCLSPVDLPVELKGGEVVELTDEQQTAMENITEIIESGSFRTILLNGVTGSGKTEIYIRAIEQVVRAGKSAIMLVPEIVLTPQMSARFGHRFERVAILHSRLSDGERAAVWDMVEQGEYDVVIGPRSALFAPLPDPGLIIVDEEHENTFKQESSPRYHARDLSVYMGSMKNIPVILGSATPSLESLANASSGKYELCSLTKRAGGGVLPDIRVINLADEFREKKTYESVSLPLRVKIKDSLDRGEQVIIFMNQRGYSRFVFCPLCGKSLKCSDCDITLTYHKKTGEYLCHYCGYSRREFSTCPQCGFNGLKKGGTGTEKLEQELSRMFPDAAVHRVDSDSMRAKSSYRDVLTRFARNEIQILVGTQIVAKGLDFPNVTTVGIVGIENMLNLPDFRSPERTFQMICQVAGRAGRGERRGTVMIEVFDSDHYAVQCAANYDYDRFYSIENRLRSELGYPPFGSLVRVLIQGPDRDGTETFALRLKNRLKNEKLNAPFQILGPVEAPLGRIKNKYRFHCILKVKGRIPAKGLFNNPDLFAGKGNISVTVDVDPVSLL